MKKHFRTIAKISLVCVYFIIIAGAVVRMTGSGMGCPDWPKCFGYYVPPSTEAEIQFLPNHEYNKGTIIVNNETLLIAKKDFTTAQEINTNNWDLFTKHDYAKYNPTHTWIEFINRMFTVLAGIPILIMLFASFSWRKTNTWIPTLAILTIIGMGIQAWLGKTVVDSNLAPYKITIHMVMALLIVAFILISIYITKDRYRPQRYNNTFKNVLIVTIILSLIQIIIGTQVRQDVDQQIKLVGNVKSMWLANPDFKFYIHRSFSILIFLTNAWLLITSKKLNLGYKKLKFVMACIVIEIISGIAMYYFDFPFSTQTIHVVLASILVGIQFYIFLECRSKTSKLA